MDDSWTDEDMEAQERRLAKAEAERDALAARLAAAEEKAKAWERAAARAYETMMIVANLPGSEVLSSWFTNVDCSPFEIGVDPVLHVEHAIEKALAPPTPQPEEPQP